MADPMYYPPSRIDKIHGRQERFEDEDDLVEAIVTAETVKRLNSLRMAGVQSKCGTIIKLWQAQYRRLMVSK